MAYLDGKTVFLAGVTGLAGHAIARRLLDGYQDIRLRACVHRTRPYCELPRLEYVNGDLRLPDDCRRMLRGCDAAIMAAASGGGAAVLNSEPWRQVNDNLFMASSFLEACFMEKVKRVVLANSATLYQECAGHIREEQLDLNQDPHPSYFGVGWVTRFVEKLCAFWRSQGGISIMIGRTSNIFGPYASFDPGRSNFIPALIRKAVEKREPFEVWGSPDVVRDVLYVDDFARAVELMMNRTDIEFDVFNVCSGEQTAVHQVVAWALKHAGHRPAKLEYRQDRPVTIRARTLDRSKAERVLGWRPEVSIEDGIARTVAWWVEHQTSWKK